MIVCAYVSIQLYIADVSETNGRWKVSLTFIPRVSRLVASGVTTSKLFHGHLRETVTHKQRLSFVTFSKQLANLILTLFFSITIVYVPTLMRFLNNATIMLVSEFDAKRERDRELLLSWLMVCTCIVTTKQQGSDRWKRAIVWVLAQNLRIWCC